MLLIDKQMPSSCANCVCCDDYFRCNLLGEEFEHNIWESRRSDCTLIELPKWEWRGKNDYCDMDYSSM